MLLEPSRTPYDLNFALLGIPVRVHPMFWAIAALFGMSVREPSQLLIWVGVVFVSILVHEMGHALTARYFGASPAITLYSFGGLASFRLSGASARRHILILLAGPGAGFLFALVVMGIVIVSGKAVAFRLPMMYLQIGNGSQIENDSLGMLVFFLLFINIFWGIINLLPVYPLDGGQIARHLFTSLNPWQGIRQSLWLSVLAGGLIAALALAGQDVFIAIFFAYLAFNSYQALQGTSGGLGGW